jgi:hypothetical protein
LPAIAPTPPLPLGDHAAGALRATIEGITETALELEAAMAAPIDQQAQLAGRASFPLLQAQLGLESLADLSEQQRDGVPPTAAEHARHAAALFGQAADVVNEAAQRHDSLPFGHEALVPVDFEAITNEQGTGFFDRAMNEGIDPLMAVLEPHMQ